MLQGSRKNKTILWRKQSEVSSPPGEWDKLERWPSSVFWLRCWLHGYIHISKLIKLHLGSVNLTVLNYITKKGKRDQWHMTPCVRNLPRGKKVDYLTCYTACSYLFSTANATQIQVVQSRWDSLLN